MTPVLIRSLRAVVSGSVSEIGIPPVAVRSVRSNDGARDET